MQLGDMVTKALSSIGITSERVEHYLGRPCGCKERARKLNALGAWARRVLGGKKEDAEKHLDNLIEQGDPGPVPIKLER